MTQSRFACTLFGAAMMFFLISCGGSTTSEQTNTDSTTVNGDTTTKMPAETTPANTIIATPENMVIVTHKVANFAKWQDAFEAHDSARLASGLHKYVIGRGLTDSNMLLVAMKADDMAKAKAFAKDPGLKKAMQQGGVMGIPSMSFVTAAWQDTVTLNSDIRSLVTLTVKNRDAWQKGFEEGKQERMENGITDRVVSYDADNDKKVYVVTALQDTAKAFAYYKSDALKKRREASGVTGQPTRFLFRVVRRY